MGTRIDSLTMGEAKSRARSISADLNVGFVLRLGRYALVDFGPTLAYEHATQNGDEDQATGFTAKTEGTDVHAGARVALLLTF